MSQSPTAIGTALRTLRTAAGMTLQQLSDAAGVSLSYISLVETGQKNPRPDWLATVTRAIGEHVERKQRDAA
jgi:transcriptional regulator with XRE-family HTH domain